MQFVPIELAPDRLPESDFRFPAQHALGEGRIEHHFGYVVGGDRDYWDRLGRNDAEEVRNFIENLFY